MVWNVHDHKWQRSFAAAQDYYNRHGNLRVPVAYQSPGPDPIRLGTWVSKQRSAFRDNKLSAERVTALTRIGMKW